ncbi:3-deoxy-D-manno-octulosonic acid transferase [Wenzhouxiangella sp. AB-CW3]|uniref:3-deoxy-D-manno-octulosonic acid transferase n=1 Tax=Wenzhouxiangella sp. AB-CW3 TaxID=2771012 RepID=UPI00168AAF21|nr:3-deoxy-D-manno-octulosonic acid transferase [Wenzhouxiangella sp. AB-CW3]QOC21843.1 3-deoxy-D-manno-octulosonic acid transferase [Wenzhouxiangella sp. AB-CW3]
MLSVYRLLTIAAAPLALGWLRWRAPGPVAMRRRWRERSGRLPVVKQPVIWVHAASFGEVNAIQALVQALLKRYPDDQIALSTFTATGLERAEQLFGERVLTTFVALDTPGRVKRWLDRIGPRVGIIVETEIWPELFAQCRRREIPLILVNARLAPGAMKHYRRWRGLFSRALEAVAMAGARDEDDARRFQELGLDESRTRVTGNLKFDMPLPDNLGERAGTLRRRWGHRPVWVAGSTREGEERIVLAAHRRIMAERPDALLVLAPRHPERCKSVRQLMADKGFSYQSIKEDIGANTAVVLVDGLGMLMSCYAAAPVAFVGGSLVNAGGHNLLEPAAFGKVVIAGPHLHQQADTAAALNQAGALAEVANDAELAREVLRIWSDPQLALERGRAALGVVEQGRGSVRRTLGLIERTISAATD